ncbi:hypothetical protein KJ763_00260 [Patescibacteria group bacterium]|nr:hypothetical protein [Patescibacteria group bacterium]
MKRFIPYILILAIIGIGILGPIGAKISHAGFLDLPSVGDFVKRGMAWVGYWILTIVSKTVSIAGFFSDAAISYSIDNQGQEGSMVVVEEGWALCRDIVNLFFIFILLYIAIATILQISGYGIKDLLVKVIIIALLVNFSLLITKVIIDSSNVLASEFYSMVTNIEVLDSNGNSTGETIKSPSVALVNGINPQNLFDSTVIENAADNGGDNATITQIIIITFLGSVLLLVIAFVLFAVGVFFVIRIAVLWLLMILAPLAFLAMVLPGTKSHANKWWSRLFCESFYAPVYLFLFYLVVKITSSGSILKDLAVNNATFGTAIGSPNDANVRLILNFGILIVLTLACLVISRQMGCGLGQTVMKLAKTARNKAQGYAGRISRGGAGYVAEKALQKAQEKPQGGFAKSLRVVPGVTRGLARMSSWKEQQTKEKEKKYGKIYGSYSQAGLKAMESGGPILSKTKKEEIQKIITKKTMDEEKKIAKKEKITFDENRMKQIEEELKKIEKAREGITNPERKTIYEERVINLDAEISSLQGSQSPEDKNKIVQIVIEKRKLEEALKKVENFNKEKEAIKERQEKRIETEEMYSKIAEVEKKAGAKSEEKKEEKPAV